MAPERERARDMAWATEVIKETRHGLLFLLPAIPPDPVAYQARESRELALRNRKVL